MLSLPISLSLHISFTLSLALSSGIRDYETDDASTPSPIRTPLYLSRSNTPTRFLSSSSSSPTASSVTSQERVRNVTVSPTIVKIEKVDVKVMQKGGEEGSGKDRDRVKGRETKFFTGSGVFSIPPSASSSGSAGGNRYGGSGSSSSSSSSSGSDVVGEVVKSVALISLTSESDSTTAPVTIHSTARTRTGVSDSSTAGPGLDPGQIQRGVHPRKGAEKGVEREREREREGGDDEDKSSSSSTSEVTSQTLSEEFHARGYALRKTGK